MRVGFLAPEVILVFPLALAVCGVLLRRGEARREALRSLIGFSKGIGGSRQRILAPLFLLFFGLAALARPYTGYRDIEVPVVGGDLMVVLDVSLSMQAADAPPSRIEAAKRKILDLIDWVGHRFPGTRVGITLFAGSAHLYAPLTSDYNVIRQFTQAINSSFVTRGGSGLAVAINKAIQSLEESGAASPIIVLLSDGEDRSFDQKRLKKKSHKAVPSMLTLGIGSHDGAPIPTEDGHYLRDRNGNTVISRLDDAPLSRIAEAFQGRYQSVGTTDDDFSSFLTEKLVPLSSLSNARTGDSPTENLRIYDEVGPYLCLSALIGLIVLILIGKHHCLALVLLCLYSLCARAEEPTVSPPLANTEQKDITARDAYRAYLGGDYVSAADGFRSARKADPTNLDLLQAEASTAFRLKQFGPAERLFGELARKTPRARQRFEARYNRGNALLAAREYKKAIESYDEALSLIPNDVATIGNKELASQLLLQEQQQQQQQQQNKGQEKNNQKHEKNTQQQKEEESRQDLEQQHTQPSENEPGNDTKEQESTGQNKQDASSSNESSQENEPRQNDHKGPSEDQDNSDSSQKGSPTESDQKTPHQDAATAPSPTPTSEETPSGFGGSEDAPATPKQSGEEGSTGRSNSTAEEQPTPAENSRAGTSSNSADSKQSSEPSARGTGENSTPGEQQRTLAESEAEHWLSSLPDAPILLRRFERNNEPPAEQQW